MPAHKYKTSKGTMWYASINYIDPITKKSTQKVKRGFATQREAKQYETDFRAEIQKNGFNPLINPKASFLDVYAAYQRHVECKELRSGTIETKANMINNYIIPYFEKYTIGEIDENVLTSWKNHMRSRTTKHNKPLSETYLHSIQAQLNAILNYAVKKGYIKVSPMLDLKNLGSKYANEHEIWTPEEFDKFAFAAMDRPKTYCLFLIYFWCGLRRGEGLGLFVSDVVFEDDGFCYLKVKQSINGKQEVKDPKNDGSKRRLYLPDFLAEELREYIDTLYDPQPTDRLFNVSLKTLYDDFNAACKAAGVKRIRIHDLRHSYASMLINSKRYSSVDVAHQLGHSSANITMRTYAHMMEPTKLDVAQTLEKIKKGE